MDRQAAGRQLTPTLQVYCALQAMIRALPGLGADRLSLQDKIPCSSLDKSCVC